MKLINVIIFFLLLINCSFDNKSGIWENENIESKIENDAFREFEKISITGEIFEEIISPKNLKFNLPKPIINSDWKDIYFKHNNNLQNFKFNNSNNIILK